MYWTSTTDKRTLLTQKLRRDIFNSEKEPSFGRRICITLSGSALREKHPELLRVEKEARSQVIETKPAMVVTSLGTDVGSQHQPSNAGGRTA